MSREQLYFLQLPLPSLTVNRLFEEYLRTQVYVCMYVKRQETVMLNIVTIEVRNDLGSSVRLYFYYHRRQRGPPVRMNQLNQLRFNVNGI